MEKILLTKKEFKTALEILNRTEKEGVRPILQGVNFTNNKVAALDGYRLSIREFNFNLNGSYTILDKDLKDIKKSLSKDIDSIEIEFIGEKANFNLLDKENNLIEIKICELLPGSYVNYKSLIPTKFEKKFDLNSKEILDIIKPLKKDSKILLSFIEDELSIFRIDFTEKKYKEVKKEYSLIGKTKMNKEIKEEFKIGINSTYLKEALKDHKENFKINFNEDRSPIVIKSNNKFDLILPVRL